MRFYCPQLRGPRPVDSGAASAGFALNKLAKDITKRGSAWHSCRKHFQKIVKRGPAYGPIKGAVAEYGKLKLSEVPESLSDLQLSCTILLSNVIFE